jgi:hypothetical protein
MTPSFQSSSFDIIRDSASNAGKSVLYLNGAGAISLMTFMGHIAENIPPLVAEFVTAIFIYLVGAALGSSVFALTYLAQGAFRLLKNNLGRFFQGSAIICYLLGIVAFLYGSYAAAQTFLLFKS